MSRRLPPTALWMAIGFSLVLLAFAAPLNHDESQYVAGAVLAAHAVPYRDFMAIQPPLALWIWAPLTLAFPGWAFLAIRLSSALFGLITLLAVAKLERQVAPGRTWPLGAALMACCHPFLFTSSVARNDALPGMLLALGMVAGLRGLAGRAGWLLLSGLLLGAAGAAKLSFMPSLAAAGLMLLVHTGTRGLVAFGAGALIGLAPLALGYALQRDAFTFGVFEAPMTAPFDWYAQTGDRFDLSIAGKLEGTFGAMLVGPILIALAIVVSRAREFSRNVKERFLLSLTGAGLIGALLPTPSHPQYLLPMLPPLFALLPGALDQLRRKKVLAAGLGLFAAVGLTPSLGSLSRGFPALRLEQQAHHIGSIARGPIASLSPDRVADSGLTLDPRFATGPFLFRSGSVLSDEEARRYKVATPSALAAMFRERPPGAVLVGYENPWRSGAPAPDAALAEWAERHGYRATALPDGQGRLYVAPRPTGDSN